MVRPRKNPKKIEAYTLTWSEAMNAVAGGKNIVQADYMNVRWGVVMEDGRLYCYNPTLGGKYPFEADARARGARWRMM
jgi:hypothetical protein